MKSLAVLSAALLALSTSGCVYEIFETHDQLLLAGRYGELARLQEEEISRTPQPTTIKLHALCVSYAKLKRYNRLFPCLDKLEANIKAVGTTGNLLFPIDATPLPPLMRADAYLELGDYARAIDGAKQGYGLIRDGYNRTHETELRIKALTTLSLAHAFSGDFAAAAESRKRLEGVPIPFAGSGFNQPEKQNSLAKVYIALGQYDSALAYLKGDQGWIRSLGDVLSGAGARGESLFTFQELPRVFMLHKCLLETGKVQEAKAGYDRLLQAPQTQDNGEIYWLILNDRGRIAEHEGKRAEAIGFYKKAIDVIERQRASIHTEASKIGFIADKQGVYQRLIAALFGDRQYTQAFEYIERAKARALVDMLAAKQDFAVPAQKRVQLRALLARAETAEADARIQDASIPGGVVSQSRSLAIQARRDLNEQAPELASLVSVAHVALADIQARIPADEALVEYYADDKNLYGFVLTQRTIHAVSLDGVNLAADVQRFRTAVQDPGSQAYFELSQRLYRRLVTPLESVLTQRKLIIVAHGPLHYLPFNALHDGREYLIERYSLRLLPSASVIKYLKTAKSARAGGLLAFGNPDLGDPRYDLVHAQTEALAVSQAIPQSRVLVRKQASETAFKQYGADFSYLHFASHGQFDAAAPLKSALLLAGDAQNDGRLTVGELYSLSLDADLVTLSACETGLGKIASGDDVVGLARGFLYAGSRSIVASLWKVDDAATAHLMTKFYATLKQADTREALRAAQLATRKKYDHPYYWAAFQLTGNAL